MTRVLFCLSLLVCLPAWPQSAGLSGTVTDPSGAAVPGASVQLRGRGDRRVRTDQEGRYAFSALPAGKYQVRVGVKGFAQMQTNDFAIDRPAVLDIRLTIQAGKQVITVEDQGRGVSAEPESNSGALVLRTRQIAILSDDPDELALQLQALAGPAPGPNGGQMFIDGFTGGALPPKSAILEVRVNSNPFSPEYDRPGFARVEIFTKPGSETFRGQAFAQFNDRVLNARNPLLGESAPYRARFYGLNLDAPVRRNRASFTLGLERRAIDESGVVLATILDSGLNPVTIDQASPRPQTRTNISPRLDYALNPKNTLAVRYLELRAGLDNQGVGDFNLPSRAYDEKQSEHTAQVTETAILSPRAINESHLQLQRTATGENGLDNSPAINVQGAFNGGGSISGISGTSANSWEWSNISTFTRGRQTLKWGGRLRQSTLTDTSRFDFAGVYTFYTLEQYRDTLAGVPGAVPSTFRLNAGTPETRVRQADAGLFVNNDWRVRRNVTVSAGLRYEAQTNLSDSAAWAPRLAVAWGITKKTVLRAGAGVFYDRVPPSVTLNARRYDGTTQQSYLILNPTFFPSIPSAAALNTSRQPQQLQPVASNLDTPRLYQASMGIERQINQASRVTLTWIGSRGVHLLNVRNVNSPIAGAYPYGDSSIRLLTESAGLSSQNQAVANVNITRKRIFLFGYYALSYGHNNNEGLPADSYDLNAEWGPSAYADLHHKVVLGTSVPLLAKITVNPFFAANSGQPYNITTGLDPNNTGYPAARPALLPGCGPQNATDAACFQLQGSPAIGHNFARGPGAVNLALRVSRTWSFDRYSVTATASTLNALNHANFAAPSGNLTSPYFGQYRALGGFIVMAHDGTPSSYNRKVDLQVRLTF